MYIDQISIFVENRLGRLAEITGIINASGIDIRALSIADTADFGILRLIVSDPQRAADALRGEGAAVSVTKVIAVRLDDHPGALHNVLSLLSDNGISVEYAYAFITRKEDDAYVILRIENLDEAAALLARSGIGLLPASEVYSL